MTRTRIGWKVLFFIVLFLVLSSIHDVLFGEPIPDIIAPTHPTFLSVILLILDLFILLGAFNFAFTKKVIISVHFWQMSFILYLICNMSVLGFEFYNRYDGYTADEMISVSVIKLFIVFCLSLPTYNYYSIDLKTTE